MIFCAAAALYSCSEKYDVYNLPHDRLGFVYGTDSFGSALTDSVQKFSFVYMPSEIVEDTVWVEMATSGFVTDKDRAFMVEQVQLKEGDLKNVEGVVNAEAGKHFVAFSDSQLAPYFVVKAGNNSVKFPVVVKRNDPSLSEGSVHLRIKLKENDAFKESFQKDRFYTIEITNQLVQPVQWDVMEYYFAGDYGPVKLRFMIDNSTWTINEEWFADNFGSYAMVDMGYTGYLSTYYTNKLIELNRARQAQGLEPLKESDGKIVQFVNYGAPQPYI